MYKLIKPYLSIAIGAVVGGVIGYFVYQYYGCTNGCSITGSPLNSTLYFAFMGALTPNIFKKKKLINHD
jgi:hypothetical protein